MLSFMRPRGKLETAALYEDNSGAIHLAHKPRSSIRSRHIDIHHHLIREVVKRSDIKIIHVETKLQQAGLLTEKLSGDTFRKYRRSIHNEHDFGRAEILLLVKKREGCPSLTALLRCFLRLENISGRCSWFGSSSPYVSREEVDSYFALGVPPDPIHSITAT